MTVADNIKTIRKQKGLTQKQLAELICVSVGAVQQFEYGKIVPKMDTVLLMSTKLNVSPRSINPEISWDDYIDTETLSKEVQVFESLPDYDEDDIDTFSQFLSLNPDGKQKVSEYIQDLMPKYKK